MIVFASVLVAGLWVTSPGAQAAPSAPDNFSNAPTLMPLGAAGTKTGLACLGFRREQLCQRVAVASNGTLYAGGIFTQTGGISSSYIAKWNESGSWSALGSGVNSYVDALVVDGRQSRGGYFTVAGG
jgi:hypothetical protein